MMLIMGAIGDSDCYTESENNLNRKSTLEDYLNGDNSKASFFGELTKGVEYSKDVFENYFASLNADGTNSHVKQQQNHKAGYDIVLTFEKLISLLYVTLDKDQREKFDTLIKATVPDFIESEFTQYLKPSCKKSKYSQFDESKAKMAGAIFAHYENRNQDPHYHSQINLFIFSEFTMNDGGIEKFAIDPQDLFAAQKMLSAKLDFILADKLAKEFSISLHSEEHSVRVDGISEDHIQAFSERNTSLIKKFEERQRQQGIFYSSLREVEIVFDDEFSKSQKAEYIERLRKGTANNKEVLSYPELIKVFKDKLADKIADLNLDLITQSKTSYTLTPEEKLDIVEDCIENLVKTNSMFSKENLQTQLYRSFAGTNTSLSEIDDLIRNSAAVIKIDDNAYTTEDVIIKSFQTIEKLDNLKDCIFSNLNPCSLESISEFEDKIKSQKHYFKGFNEGQIQAMHVATNSHPISLIIGDAGTGKTSSVIAFATEHYSNSGQQVIGLATQGKTAKALAYAEIKKTFNLAEFNAKIAKGEVKLTGDEAGMVDTEHFFNLMNLVEKHNVKLILVCDDKQLASVGYGSMFKCIKDRLSDDCLARLDINCRQKTIEQQTIAEAFRDKQLEIAINQLKILGDLHTAKDGQHTKKELLDQLVYKYFSSPYEKKIVIAFENKNVNDLNDSIRSKLVEQKVLNADNQVGFDVYTSSTSKKAVNRYFTQNDKIVLTAKLKNVDIYDDEKQTYTKDRKNYIDNSTLATVEKIEGSKVYCISDEGIKFIIDTKEFCHFSHSYAVTTYKSQRQTIQDCYVFSSGMTTSNQAYVDFSRCTDRVSLFINEDHVSSFIQQAKKEQVKFDITKNENANSIYLNHKKQEATNLEAKDQYSIIKSDLKRIIKDYRASNIQSKSDFEKCIAYASDKAEQLKLIKSSLLDQTTIEESITKAKGLVNALNKKFKNNL